MKTEIKSWRRFIRSKQIGDPGSPETCGKRSLGYYEDFNTPVAVVVLDPEVADLDAPPKGTRVRHSLFGYRTLTVWSEPMWSEHRRYAVVVIKDPDGSLLTVPLDDLKIPETHRYRVEVEAANEEEARDKVRNGQVTLREEAGHE